jgi:hypothetical protein
MPPAKIDYENNPEQSIIEKNKIKKNNGIAEVVDK